MSVRMHHSTLYALLVTTSFTALFMVPAFAQGVVPGAVDPSKLQQRVEPTYTPKATRDEGEISGVANAKKHGKQTGAKIKSQNFVLKTVSIEGATVYTQADLEAIFKDSLGKHINREDAGVLVDQITQKYRNDGYILSQAIIPKQDVKDGVLKIRVVEGFISKVSFQGDAPQAGWHNVLQNIADNITEKHPLNIADLERYLLLMDDLPGITAKGLVHPSPDVFGAADLTVQITLKTLEASLSADNRGSKYVGPLQYTATASENSLLGLYERTTARILTTSPTTELRFFDVLHEEQLDSEGTRLTLSDAYSVSQPGDSIASLRIHSASTFAQAKLLHPFIRARSQNLNGRLTFDYRNTDTNIARTTKLTNDRLTSIRLGGSYDVADAWNGVNLIDGEASQGLTIFNSTNSGIARTRTDGVADYRKINLNLSRTQTLPAQFSLLTSVSGQYSFDKLLAAEQFSVGGAAFGGAYDAAEISGDHGISGRIELRYSDGTSWSYLRSYQAYTYYDAGRVWNRGGTADNPSLASTGIGVRASIAPSVFGYVEVGLPLTKQVATEHNNDPRLFFSLSSVF